MVLFLGLGILSSLILFQDTAHSSFSSESSFSLHSVSMRYDNLYREIIDLDRETYGREVFQRILPFTYLIDPDSNSLIIQQSLPLSQSKLKNYFDSINLAEIFFTDTQRSNIYDGINMDINSLKNPDWGGNETKGVFLLTPVCYKYEVLLSGEVNFGGASEYTTKCGESFNSSSIRRIDINIFPNSGDDYSSLLCEGVACATDVFNPLNPLPYLNINVIDTNCISCKLTAKTASFHFDSTTDSNISLSCTDANCTSLPLIIQRTGVGVSLIHSSGGTILVATKIGFNSKINGFFAPDVNLSVSTLKGNYRKNSQ